MVLEVVMDNLTVTCWAKLVKFTGLFWFGPFVDSVVSPFCQMCWLTTYGSGVDQHTVVAIENCNIYFIRYTND